MANIIKYKGELYQKVDAGVSSRVNSLLKSLENIHREINKCQADANNIFSKDWDSGEVTLKYETKLSVNDGISNAYHGIKAAVSALKSIR